MKKLTVQHYESDHIDFLTKLLGVLFLVLFVAGIIIANQFGLNVK